MLDVVDEITADAASRTPEQFRRRLNERAREISDDDGVTRSEQQRDEARLHVDLDESSGMGQIRGKPDSNASTRQLTITYPDGTLHSRSLPDLLADLAPGMLPGDPRPRGCRAA